MMKNLLNFGSVKSIIMAKQEYRKVITNSKNGKTGFRTVQDSPAPTKIDKATIDKAVKKAIAAVSR